MTPATCRFCGRAEWAHRCGLKALTGEAKAPTETPRTKAKAKFAARKKCGK